MSDGKRPRQPDVIARACLYICLCAMHVSVSVTPALSAAPGTAPDENPTHSIDGTVQLDARPSVAAAGNEVEITAWPSTPYGYPGNDVRIRFSLGDDSVDRFIDVGSHGAASLLCHNGRRAGT